MTNLAFPEPLAHEPSSSQPDMSRAIELIKSSGQPSEKGTMMTVAITPNNFATVIFNSSADPCMVFFHDLVKNHRDGVPSISDESSIRKRKLAEVVATNIVYCKVGDFKIVASQRVGVLRESARSTISDNPEEFSQYLANMIETKGGETDLCEVAEWFCFLFGDLNGTVNFGNRNSELELIQMLFKEPKLSEQLSIKPNQGIDYKTVSGFKAAILKLIKPSLIDDSEFSNANENEYNVYRSFIDHFELN